MRVQLLGSGLASTACPQPHHGVPNVSCQAQEHISSSLKVFCGIDVLCLRDVCAPLEVATKPVKEHRPLGGGSKQQMWSTIQLQGLGISVAVPGVQTLAWVEAPPITTQQRGAAGLGGISHHEAGLPIQPQELGIIGSQQPLRG